MKTKCTVCNIEKEINKNNFYYRMKEDRWCRTCILCVSNKSKLYYKINSSLIKEKAKKYRLAHKDKIKDSAKKYNSKQEVKDKYKKWRQENKEKIRESEKLWKSKNPEKYKIIVNKKSKKQRENPKNKIRAHVSRQVNFALFAFNKCKEKNSILKYLPYSICELKEHLERQFEPWMNWNNYGKYRVKTWIDSDMSTWTWQIDHIIPQSDLPYLSMNDDNFKKAWSLDNLRPLNSKTNVIDGATRIRHGKLNK
jgi:hypothetical protein